MEAIVTHKNTDFDALASLIAAALLYPSAVPVFPRSLNVNVRKFLSLHKDHPSFQAAAEFDPGGIERLIVVDTSSWNRIEGHEKISKGTFSAIHLWDHHRPGDIRPEWSCVKQIGATVTLLVGELQRQGKDFSPIEATLFAAGIYEDTGNLTFPSTTSEDAGAVAFLLEKGADLNLIKNILRPVYGPRQKEILSEMLKNENRVKLNGYAVAFNRISIEGHTPGLSLVMDMYMEISGVDASFGIFEEPEKNQSIVIGRSSTESLDIGAIMRSLGGGGHPSAGSAMVKGMSAETIEQVCRERFSANNKAPVKISDLMSYPVLTVSPKTPMWEAAMLFREKGCTGLPVVDEHGLVGIITRRDFRKGKKPLRMDSPVKAFMSTKVVWISPGSSVDQASKLMVKHDIGRLPVMDEGKIIGIVTRSDIMRFYYDLLPD
ncbi:MAG: CBS domain-containing protein [Deltaproteobacteria bacterium]|nr:CBS domain-containing protein [Deltaproteobacteria bacterium]MBW2018291.1 CBS domain-containing protein [Deltaproteobacteria bacterium]MBW2130812.1 CBS domain-containing protein [Deltaproteobacteria bacterium]MBW2304608.1 CBS domain-containing protein [Deltaproteobacteria bacterium]